MRHATVLICGGGPVGLTASMLLSELGISNVVVEKRPSTTQLPRARGMNCRTGEIWRSLGLADRMEGISLPAEWTEDIVYCTTLAGDEIGTMPSESMSRKATAAYSPAPFLSSSQIEIDALLHEAATAQPQAEVRFGHEVTHVEDDGAGVTADISTHDGRQYQVRADWLIAADGANSTVRQAVGVQLDGVRTSRWYLNSHFHADLSRFTDHRKGALIWTLEPGLEGVFQPLDGEDDWSCGVLFDAETESPDDFTTERVITLIQNMIGAPGEDVGIDLLNFRPWFVAATVASQLRSGRVLLAGDSAHQIPPFGGMGMNTGIQDAHALAWRIAAVVRGSASEELLDTYSTERREVALRICDFAKQNMQHVTEIRSRPSAERVQSSREYGNWNGLDMGVHYTHGALVPDGTSRPTLANEVTEYVPDARPGSRAPHRWLTARTGTRLSTLDLFKDAFVLLTTEGGASWRAAARRVSDRRALPLRAVQIAPGAELEDEEHGFARAYGIAADGAVLVRPDGHVAFRAPAAVTDPDAVLEKTLDAVLGKKPVAAFTPGSPVRTSETTLDWLGCATFRLSVGNTVVFLDAYMDRVTSAPQVGMTTDDVDRADWILIGHSHWDHLWGADRIALRTGAKVVGSYETVRVLLAQGVPQEQLIPVAGGERIRLGEGVSVRVFPSLHSCVWAQKGAPAADEVCVGDLGLFLDEQQARFGEVFEWIHTLGTEVGSHLRATAQGAQGDGGSLVYLIETPEGSLLYQDTSGSWSGVLRGLSPDVAILAAGGRANVDGEPVQGTLADFVAHQARLLGPRQVILSHHDDFLPGFSQQVDAGPIREAMAREAPATTLTELTYLSGHRLFTDL